MNTPCHNFGGRGHLKRDPPTKDQGKGKHAKGDSLPTKGFGKYLKGFPTAAGKGFQNAESWDTKQQTAESKRTQSKNTSANNTKLAGFE